MKRAICRFIAGVMSAAVFVSANARYGTTSYDFLNIPTSSHVTALGGQNIALIDDDVSLVEQNPALLGPEVEKQIGISYMHWFGSSNFASVRYGMAAGERAAWSVGLRYMNFGSIDGYDENGVATGSFTPSDVVFGGSYTHDFNDRWRGGISLNMVSSSYEKYSAFAITSDVGVNYYDWDHDLSFSMVLKNMGGQLKRFSERYNPLPFDIQMGYMQRMGHSPFSLAITATHLTKWKVPTYVHDENNADSDGSVETGFLGNFFRHLTFGLQYNGSENFYIALGYDYLTRCSFSTYQRNFLSGFSLGMGLRVKGWGFGVAYSQPHKGASTIQLNLFTNLNSLF